MKRAEKGSGMRDYSGLQKKDATLKAKGLHVSSCTLKCLHTYVENGGSVQHSGTEESLKSGKNGYGAFGCRSNSSLLSHH